jgi:hypothetical protein
MAALTLATMYTGPTGAALYCSISSDSYVYSTDTTSFLALPVESYLDGSVQCGDLMYIRFPNGSTLLARALDAGPFASYCVVQPDGTCPSIGMDVPSHLWPVGGISGWVEVVNLSAAYRASCAGGNVERPSPLGSSVITSAGGGMVQ